MTAAPLNACATNDHICDFCRNLPATKRSPKTFDFSQKHAYSRYGIGEHIENVNFWNVRVYDMAWSDFIRQHPDWMVTAWVYVCSECLPFVCQSPESFDRIMHFLEVRCGKDAVDAAIELAVHDNFVPIMDAVIKQQRKKERRVTDTPHYKCEASRLRVTTSAEFAETP